MSKSISHFIIICLASVLLAVGTGSVNCLAALSDLEQENSEQPASLQNKLQNQAYKINFKGNSYFSGNELLKKADNELRMFEQRGYRKADIDDAAYQMRSAYLQAGFAFALVDYTYEQKEDYLGITFDIEEGPQVFIKELVFKGNTTVQEEILRGFLQQPSRSLRRQQGMIYTESEMRDEVNSIRDYYLREGYIDVKVKSPELVFTDDRTGVSITIEIEEGVKYFIHEVVLSGDIIDELTADLEKIKNEFAGQPYFVRRKLLLRASLEEVYDSIGFAEAEFEIDMLKLDEPGRVKLTVVIKSGEIIRIAKINISGNTSTKESFIRHRLQFKAGDIYTNAKRRESFRKLFDSGLFTRIFLELTPPNQDGSRDLEVRVEEFHTRGYYVEPGWGSYEKIRLRAGVFERNLFGTGRNGRLDGLISTKSENFTVSYTDPWLLQTDISMNVPLSYDHRDEPSYTSEEIGLSVLFSKKLSRNFSFTTGYHYKITQLYSLTDDTLLPKGEDDYNKGTIGIQAVWDTRDDIFYPSEGLRLAGGFDISLPAFGSDLEYGRITLGGRYFWELPQEYIIGLRVTTGLIMPIGNQTTIPISERFFNGGSSSVRSYKHSELGPKDENNEPLGGLGYNVFSVELRRRFYKNFAATLYVDAGNVSPNRSLYEKDFVPYTNRSDLLDDTLADFFSEFKFGVGIGLQYLLPVGPIRVDIAYNPAPEEIWHEDTWVFHFSLGMAF